jgi:hypothetical protein
MRSNGLDPSEPVCERKFLHAISTLCARAADINCGCAVSGPKPAFARSALSNTITVFSKFVLSVAQLDEAEVAVAGALVALGGRGVWVRVAVGGGTVVGIFVAGIGVSVRV